VPHELAGFFYIAGPIIIWLYFPQQTRQFSNTTIYIQFRPLIFSLIGWSIAGWWLQVALVILSECHAVSQPAKSLRHINWHEQSCHLWRISDKEKDLLASTMTSTAHNPIIPGFAPDPSICLIDGTYFLVNSSFHLYPGLPIYSSDDLISWKHIGNSFLSKLLYLLVNSS
jgi:hypothetical protein